MITDEEEKRLIVSYLMKKLDAQYFGKVIIVFQNGRVIHIVEES
jgi:hypothetical protein